MTTLMLVTATLAATSGTLKLASLGAHVRLGVAVRYTRCQTKVTNSLALLAWTCAQDTRYAIG